MKSGKKCWQLPAHGRARAYNTTVTRSRLLWSRFQAPRTKRAARQYVIIYCGWATMLRSPPLPPSLLCSRPVRRGRWWVGLSQRSATYTHEHARTQARSTILDSCIWTLVVNAADICCLCVCALPETRDPEHKYRMASKKTAQAPARARGLLGKVGVDGKRAADRRGSGRGRRSGHAHDQKPCARLAYCVFQPSGRQSGEKS